MAIKRYPIKMLAQDGDCVAEKTFQFIAEADHAALVKKAADALRRLLEDLAECDDTCDDVDCCPWAKARSVLAELDAEVGQ